MVNQAIPLWLKDEVAVQRGLPIYMQLKEALRSAILSRKLEPGSPLPEERELAALLKLSRGTVRRALEFLVQEKLIVRHHGRRSVVADQTRLPAIPLAVVFERGESLDASAYLGQIVQTMTEAAAALGAEVLLREISTQRIALNPAAHLFIMPTSPGPLHELTRKGQRVISVDVLTPGVDSVVYDNACAFADMTRRLIALGHRRIAYIDVYYDRGGVRVGNPNSAERMRGYGAALNDAGLPVLTCTHAHIAGVLAAALPEFMRRTKATAIAAFDETVAADALRAAQAAGLSVPRDLSIATIFLKEYGPRGGDWSGVEVSQSELSRKAIARAVKRCENASLTEEVIALPWTWCPGTTLASPRQHD